MARGIPELKEAVTAALKPSWAEILSARKQPPKSPLAVNRTASTPSKAV